MSEYKCPLCGKDVEKDEPFCRDCQRIAENSCSEDLVGKKPSTQSAQDSTTRTASQLETMRRKPSRNKKIFLLVLGIVVSITIGVIGSYAYYESKQSSEIEENYWNICQEENSPLAYSKYLVRYSSGKYSSEAHTRILELRDKEQKEWAVIRQSTDISTYFAFLSDHPNSPYEREIRQTIDSLNWELAVAENSMKSYLIYIDNASSGNFAGEYKEQALERYEYLSQLLPVEGDEKEEVTKRVSDFMKALSSTQSQDALPFMAPILSEFDGQKNGKKEEIIASMQADIKEKQIKSITYTTSFDTLTVMRDNRGFYLFTLPVEKQVVYIDKKINKEVSNYTVDMELNENKEVSRLNPKIDDKP